MAEVVTGLGHAGPHRQRLPDERCALFRRAGLHPGEAHKVQAVEVPGICLEHARIERLRLGEPPGLVQGERLAESLVRLGHGNGIVLEFAKVLRALYTPGGRASSMRPSHREQW